MYSRSDIHFTGSGFNFTLKNVIASDRPSKFSIDEYFNPLNATIPQANFRIGYFIKNNIAVTVGFDHMKYVVNKNQVVKINGEISSTETPYDGIYSNNDITIDPSFLKFEHTNGLNYINMDVRRFGEIVNFNKIKLSVFGGVGAGILLPKTNTTLFNHNNNDQYHLSGYGMNGLAGINLSFFKFLFLQSEFKYGIVNMPDIRISKHAGEKASQQFSFSQFNILVGANINLHHGDDDQ